MKRGKNAELIRSVKFTLFSLSAGVIQAASFALLCEVLHFDALLHLPKDDTAASYLVALVLSVVWNFTLNRRYTFRSANNVPVAMLKVALFYAVFTPVTTWLEHRLTGSCGWNGYLVTALNMLLNFVLEFLYDRFFVFRNSIDTRKDAENAPTESPIKKK